jgi:proton translocating ATP synthase F1 alpha subunit
MAIRSDEITSIIRSEISGFDEGADVSGVGTIVEVGDGIAQIYGLSGALASELLEFPGGVMGMAFNLEEETVGALILGDYTELKEGDQVKTTGRVVEVPVGEALIGRVVNPLGEPIDGKGPIETTRTRPIERIAPGVIVRQPVDTPVQTGIKAIDAMIPIGRGQRPGQPVDLGDAVADLHDGADARDIGSLVEAGDLASADRRDLVGSNRHVFLSCDPVRQTVVSRARSRSRRLRTLAS